MNMGLRVAAKCHHPTFELEQAPPVVPQAVQWEAQVFREIEVQKLELKNAKDLSYPTHVDS